MYLTKSLCLISIYQIDDGDSSFKSWLQLTTVVVYLSVQPELCLVKPKVIPNTSVIVGIENSIQFNLRRLQQLSAAVYVEQ